MHAREGIDLTAVPSGTGCVECLQSGQWWFHLRRCAQCGHIGCCDTSPHRHATAHFQQTGHPIVTSFEPGEDWFYDYRDGAAFMGPDLPDPPAHPADSAVPGPVGQVPDNWEELLNG